MGQLAPFNDEKPPLDPKRQPGAYILRGPEGDQRLYRVIGEGTFAKRLEVENVATLHVHELTASDVDESELIKAAPIDDLEAVLEQTPSIPDPDDGKGDQ